MDSERNYNAKKSMQCARIGSEEKEDRRGNVEDPKEVQTKQGDRHGSIPEEKERRPSSLEACLQAEVEEDTGAEGERR